MNRTTRRHDPQRRRRSARPRRARGAAGSIYAEALVVIGFLTTVGVLVQYVHSYFRHAVELNAVVRRCAWANVTGSCPTATPASCGGLDVPAPSTFTVTDTVGQVSSATASQYTAARNSPWVGEMLGDDVLARGASTSYTSMHPRPASLGSTPTPISAREAGACDTERGTFDRGAEQRRAFCRAAPEWCN